MPISNAKVVQILELESTVVLPRQIWYPEVVSVSVSLQF